MNEVLIAGCGDVGIRLGQKLAARGCEVWGLRRRAEALPAPLRAIAADLREPESLRSLPCKPEWLVYAASADSAAEADYRAAYVDGPLHLLQALEAQHAWPRRLVFVSSTSVYAQSGGAWVDEESPAEAQSLSGRCLREAEVRLAERHPGLIVFRAAGIYGPGRTRLLRSVAEGSLALPPSPHYTNRIHREDCAAAIEHLLHLDDAHSLYLGADDEPTDLHEVVRWLCASLGVSSLPQAKGENWRRQGTSKRISNARLKATGFRFSYPTFREGYAEMIPDFLAAGGVLAPGRP